MLEFVRTLVWKRKKAMGCQPAAELKALEEKCFHTDFTPREIGFLGFEWISRENMSRSCHHSRTKGRGTIGRELAEAGVG